MAGSFAISRVGTSIPAGSSPRSSLPITALMSSHYRATEHIARGIHAKHVIFAAPQFIAARVIRDYRDVHDFVYGSWLVANLTVQPSIRCRTASRSPGTTSSTRAHPLATSSPRTKAAPIRVRRCSPTTTPFCDRDPRVARERLLSAGPDEWAEVVLSDLSRAHPEIRDISQRLDVMRWGHAMVRPHPGFITSAVAARSGAAIPRHRVREHRSQRRRALRGIALPRRPRRRGGAAAERTRGGDVSLITSVAAEVAAAGEGRRGRAPGRP